MNELVTSELKVRIYELFERHDKIVEEQDEYIEQLRERNKHLQSENTRLQAEWDKAGGAISRMAEYIVTKGRVDYFLCDEIPKAIHLKYQPKNDGNYENEPCIKCVAEYFTRGLEESECEK